MWTKVEPPSPRLRLDSCDNRNEVAKAERRLEDAHTQIAQALRRGISANLYAFGGNINAKCAYAKCATRELRNVHVRTHTPLHGSR
jgi:hypothetical protein